MKIRYGFVSNSSSASFFICSLLLTETQKKALLDINSDKNNYDGWEVTERYPYIQGCTMMNNETYIEDIFKSVGIRPEWVIMEDNY